jgi:hypothetical protein
LNVYGPFRTAHRRDRVRRQDLEIAPAFARRELDEERARIEACSSRPILGTHQAILGPGCGVNAQAAAATQDSF